MKSQLAISSDISRDKNRLHSQNSSDFVRYPSKLNTFSMIFMKSCLGSGDFPEISGILPTLRSCISELKKSFLMGPVPLQISMYKLSNKPNTIKNGYLAPKLQSIQNWKISKIGLHHPTTEQAAGAIHSQYP